jgi:hypothetical protein
VTRVSDSGSHVPSNGYSLYTCSILFGGLYTCIIYTAWYLNTSTAAVLFRYSSTTAVLSRYSSSTTVLSLVQLYGEYTRRGTLVFDPVESGAGSRLLDDVIFTSYKFFELGEVQVKCNNVECYNPQIDSIAVVRLYYRCSCTNRGTARVRLSLLQYSAREALRILPAIRNTTSDGLRGWSHQSTSIILNLV